MGKLRERPKGPQERLSTWKQRVIMRSRAALIRTRQKRDRNSSWCAPPLSRRSSGRIARPQVGWAMFVAKNITTDHKDLIHDVSYDFYGRRMATCSSDQSVKVRWWCASIRVKILRYILFCCKTRIWVALSGVSRALCNTVHLPCPYAEDNAIINVLHFWNSNQVKGVVTYTSPVETFVTGIKMESSDQRSF